MSATDWLTLALVIITAVYAWVTFRILRAGKNVMVLASLDFAVSEAGNGMFEPRIESINGQPLDPLGTGTDNLTAADYLSYGLIRIDSSDCEVDSELRIFLKGCSAKESLNMPGNNAYWRIAA